MQDICQHNMPIVLFHYLRTSIQEEVMNQRRSEETGEAERDEDGRNDVITVLGMKLS